MEPRATNWIWFQGRVHGPYFPWEVSLVHSKLRSILIYDAEQGWVGYRAWDSHSASDLRACPEAPSQSIRVSLRFRHLLLRRMLGLCH